MSNGYIELKPLNYDMKSKILTITVVAIAVLVAMIGVTSYSIQEVSAQKFKKCGEADFTANGFVYIF
jgi:hypothetical protein